MSNVVDIEEEMCNVPAVVLNEADDLGDFLRREFVYPNLKQLEG
jgi:hypothetical protein